MSDSEEFIFRSALPDADIPNVSLPEYIGACIARHNDQDAAAYIDGPNGRTYTYKQLTELMKRVAASLTERGIGQGDVIMILAPNLPEYAIAFLGIASIGAVITTCNPAYGAMEIGKQLDDSGAKMIFTVEALLPTLAKASIALPVVCFGSAPGGTTPFAELLKADPWKAPTVFIHPEDTLALPYSSGTTGVAKGVELTHRNLVSNLVQSVGGPVPVMQFQPHDVTLGLLPFFHIYGMTTLILSPLVKGIPLVVMPKFDLVEMLELIQKYRITFANLVPPVILALAKHPIVDKYDLSSMRGIMSGAAPLGKELQQAAEKRLNIKVAQGYGMTESSPITLVTRNVSARPMECTPGSAGSVVINTEAKIRDPETGKSLPPNQRGELCIRGPQVMKGYYNKPEATAATVDKDGWLLTGDVALINERGEVFVVDRVKELIKYKGFQVPPAELEALLVDHPAIVDAAVIGIPDEEAGELPMGFIQVAEGKSITEDEVKEYIAKQVVYYKRLRAVEFVEKVPKTASGKILRKELRAKVAARSGTSNL